jgi:hypothetical protein
VSNGYLIGESLLSRIRSTVDRVDGQPLRAGGASIPTRLQGVQGATDKVFRVCAFTGAWSKNTAKTVTFLGVTTTPNTVSATNLFANIATAASSRNCAIAKDGTAWYLIAAEC